MGFDLNKKQVIGVVASIGVTLGLMFAMPTSATSAIAVVGAMATAAVLFGFNTKKRRSA